MSIAFQQPAMLLLAGLVPAALVLHARAARRRAAALAAFAGSHPADEPAIRAARLQHTLRLVGTSIALGFLAIALARPGWRPRRDVLTKSGRDVVFVLDVSRSMLAEDRVPNRLENMRLAILDCLGTFEGNRVALVAFAGSPAIKSPLTADYEFFEKALRDISPLSAPQGGTRLGDALDKVAEALLMDDMQGFQDVMLITDGGDQDSRPLEAVRALNAKRTGLIVVGVGDAENDVRIPIVDPDTGKRTYVRYQSQEVSARQNRGVLQGMVNACETGLYLDAGTRPIDLANVYDQFAAHMGQRVFTTENVEAYEEEFPLFLALAALGLLVAGSAPYVAARRHGCTARAMGVAGAAILLAAALPVQPTSAGNATEDVEAARLSLEAACRAHPASADLRYRLGETSYRAGAYTNAAIAYGHALERTDRPELQYRCCYNIGACLVRAAENMSVEQMDLADDHLRQAVRYYRAALAIRPDDADAAWNLEVALRRRESLEKERQLRAAMEQQKQESQSESSEGHAMRKAEEGEDVVGEELEAGAEAMADQAASDRAKALNLESRTLPPPNITPEDVLRDEAAIDAMREKERGKNAAKVKKDW